MHGKLLEHTKAQNKYYMKAFCQGKKKHRSQNENDAKDRTKQISCKAQH